LNPPHPEKIPGYATADKCNVCEDIAALSCGMQYTVTDIIMALCVTFSRERLLSQWQTGKFTFLETGERDRLENPSVDKRVILKLIFRKWGVEWIDLAK
jgi:hypothetical protein